MDLFGFFACLFYPSQNVVRCVVRSQHHLEREYILHDIFGIDKEDIIEIFCNLYLKRQYLVPFFAYYKAAAGRSSIKNLISLAFFSSFVIIWLSCFFFMPDNIV